MSSRIFFIATLALLAALTVLVDHLQPPTISERMDIIRETRTGGRFDG